MAMAFTVLSLVHPLKAQLSGPKPEKVKNLMQTYFDERIFNGCVLVADQDGIVFKGAFGQADIENQKPLNTSTDFYLASVSKQFTAAAIMMLETEELLNFDDTIRQYLPELPSIYHGVTIRNLLNHTSGIPDYYNFANPQPGFTNQDVLNVLKDVQELEFEPGTKYRYSNSGYVLLSIIVSRISGKTFANFIRSEIFKPLKMKRSVVFDSHAKPIRNRAVGYAANGVTTDYHFRTTGGGGIFTNVEDLYRWDRGLYTDKIVPQDLLKKEAFSPTILKDGSKVYYGFGWQLEKDHPNIVWHGGELEGFRTRIFRDTDHKIAIILLSNNSCLKLKDITNDIYQILVSG